jgi:hypothetical protein
VFDEVAVAARDHVRQQRARRPHVRHDVDPPGEVPLVVGRLGTPDGPGDAGVGHVDVDRSAGLAGPRDEGADIGLVPRVDLQREPADALGDGAGAGEVAVGDHDRPRSLLREAQGQRPADAAGASGDDNMTFADLHDRLTYANMNSGSALRDPGGAR